MVKLGILLEMCKYEVRCWNWYSNTCTESWE